MYKSNMSNRSRGEGLAVGAELRHERGLFFGRREGRLERIAREEDALIRGEAALARGRVVARLDVARVCLPIFIGVPEEIRRVVGIQRHLEPLGQQLARRVLASKKAPVHL